MESDLRRSSILKQQKHRSPLTPVDVDEQSADTTLAKQNRRVSFASSNFVKQFAADPEKNTIWDTTYEETLSHTTDSSKDTQSSVELTQKMGGKTTIYYSDKNNIEVNEEIFERLPPELAMDKENLVVRKRSYEKNAVKELSMLKGANVSQMEFTETFGKIEETVRKAPVVLYRNESCFTEEISMGDVIRDDTREMEFTGSIAVMEKTVTNQPTEMEFTECIPVMLLENLEEVNGDSLEETAVVGGIVKEKSKQMEENSVEVRQNVGRRTTIYFGDNNDGIEIDKEIFERMSPKLAVDKENLVMRKRSYQKGGEKESPMQKRVNVSEMEFTETFGKINEIVRKPPIVLYRNECNTEENSMENAVTDQAQEMELTGHIPVMVVNTIKETSAGILKKDKNEFATPLLDIESLTQPKEQFSCKSSAKNQFFEDSVTVEKQTEEDKNQQNSSAAVLANKELSTFNKLPDTDEKVSHKNTSLQGKNQPKQTINNTSSVEEFVQNKTLSMFSDTNKAITNPVNVTSMSNGSFVLTETLKTSGRTEIVETGAKNPILNKNVAKIFPVLPANTELSKQQVSFSTSVSVADQTNTSRQGKYFPCQGNNSAFSINPEDTGKKDNELNIKNVTQMPTSFDQNTSEDRVETTKLSLNMSFSFQETLGNQIELDKDNQERVAQMSFNRNKSSNQTTTALSQNISNADDNNKTITSFASMKTSFVDQPSQFSNTSHFMHHGAYCNSFMPESCSMNLNFSASTDDTQYLIACNLSSNKQQPNSEYSKILTEDYNPSPVNSKLLALSDIGTSALSNYLSNRCHVSLPMEIDDEKRETFVDCSKLSQEDISFADSFASISTSAHKIAEEMSVRHDQVMEQLVVVKRRQKRIFDSKKFQENVEKLMILDETIREQFKAIERVITKKNEESVRYLAETSSSQSVIEVSEDNLTLEMSKEKEEGPSIEEQIKTKAIVSKYHWQITFEEPGRCNVSTLYRAITSHVNFDPTTGKIENIVTSVRTKDGAKPISKYVSRLFAKKLSPEMLVACLGQNFDILSFLDYVQLTFQYFLKLLDEYNVLVKTYGFEMHEDMRTTFTVIGVEQMLIWKVEVNFTDEILTEDSVKVEAQLGAVNERAVKKCINGCPQGFAAFAPFASNIKAYMNNLKRPLKN